MFFYVVQVSDIIKECRQSLAECLFAWTCQSPLSKDDTLAVIGYLETVTAEADGSLDSVNLAVVMGLLYCFDVSFLDQGMEDREGMVSDICKYYIAILYLMCINNKKFLKRFYTLSLVNAKAQVISCLILFSIYTNTFLTLQGILIYIIQ